MEHFFNGAILLQSQWNNFYSSIKKWRESSIIWKVFSIFVIKRRTKGLRRKQSFNLHLSDKCGCIQCKKQVWISLENSVRVWTVFEEFWHFCILTMTKKSKVKQVPRSFCKSACLKNQPVVDLLKRTLVVNQNSFRWLDLSV